jgi:pullulanase-type alpha-1,6-glucosidase
MMARLMIDSTESWVRGFGIDSFRFDLMGHQPRAAMEALQRRVDAAAGRHVNLIGEGWNFGEIADGARFVQASQLSLAGSGIASFSDRARDALRGGGCCDSGTDIIARQGLLNGLFYAPNALAKESRDELLRAADLARAGLAGTLRDYTTRFADGRVAPLSQLDYAGQPAGYAAAPGEVVNYVENHDNATLWDIDALKLPQSTSAAERARVQLLGAAFVAFSQGVAYFHAGFDLLRSKSLDRNSFDSGDWFNRLDWSASDNGSGAGLPPKPDNGKDWELLKPILRNPDAKPSPRDIAWMRDAFLDLLRIRTGTPLFRLRAADDVQRRLAFRNTGPGQNPLVIVGHLDGARMDGPFRELLYLVNVSPEAQTLSIPEEAGKRYRLHPVQAARDAVDDRPRLATYRSRDGRFVVPGRTAVVFVVPRE